MTHGYQMKKTNLINWVYYLLYPVVLLLLMLLPNNQYSVMNDYAYVEQTNGSLSLALVNMATVMQIMCLAIMAVIGLLGLFTAKLHTNKLETIVAIIIGAIAFISNAVFYIAGIVSADSETQVVSWGNLLVFVLHMLFFFAYVALSIITVFRPYHAIEKEVNKEETPKSSSIEEAPLSDSMRRSIYRAEMSGFDKDRMRNYLKAKRDRGEISEAQYQEFMDQLKD